MNWLFWALLALLVANVGYRLWIRKGVENVSVHEIRDRQRVKDRMMIIDVRDPHEFKRGHIDGAVNIPLHTLEQGAAHLDKGMEIMVICKSGTRSLVAYRKLKDMGFTDVRNVEGGMLRWAWDTV